MTATPLVRIVTDSSTMIPTHLAAAAGITVVPLTVTIGDGAFTEGPGVDLAAVYRRLRAGEPATTSAPSPGAFVTAYESLADAPIVSIHIGSALSATTDSARLGARISGADVIVVDTGTASFLAGCCVLAAAEAASRGGDRDAVTAAAERAAASVESVFTVAEFDRARRGGRFELDAPESDQVPIYHMRGDVLSNRGQVDTPAEAAEVMFAWATERSGPARIGVGDADAGPLVDALYDRLRAARPTDSLVRYRVGPSVAAHAGMGTFGVVTCPRSRPSTEH